MEAESKSVPRDGFVYSATGDQYVEEAIQSARQVRKVHDEDIGVVLFSDRADVGGPFTEVYALDPPAHDRTDKIGAMMRSPFERTIFLDTDTYVTEDLRDVFELLDRFDVAACHAPGRRMSLGNSSGWDNYHPDVPDSFSAYNSGLFAYKSNDKTEKFIKEWKRAYEKENTKKEKPLQDQPILREVLYEKKDVRIATLPPEYNFRVNFCGFAHGKIRMIHGRSKDVESTEREINRTIRKRVYYPPNNGEFILSRDMKFYNRIAKILSIIYTHIRLTCKSKK
ncbi:putative nucleotide-diphospho-sugar transferase [Salinibacter altiplanensis]|uniref:putative nucleotide-diphospho-sugar transferase n=1 Tax=Salinibacter altiplanensis TaxID=1803181 RepID=UPI000C9F03E5|nr:putative nucleotide-diphospho-sugar transferase [Salinibacter altiplanensis]